MYFIVKEDKEIREILNAETINSLSEAHKKTITYLENNMSLTTTISICEMKITKVRVKSSVTLNVDFSNWKPDFLVDWVFNKVREYIPKIDVIDIVDTVPEKDEDPMENKLMHQSAMKNKKEDSKPIYFTSNNKVAFGMFKTLYLAFGNNREVLAEHLNKTNLRTATGLEWSSQSVSNYINRYNLNAEEST